MPVNATRATWARAPTLEVVVFGRAIRVRHAKVLLHTEHELVMQFDMIASCAGHRAFGSLAGQVQSCLAAAIPAASLVHVQPMRVGEKASVGVTLQYTGVTAMPATAITRLVIIALAQTMHQLLLVPTRNAESLRAAIERVHAAVRHFTVHADARCPCAQWDALALVLAVLQGAREYIVELQDERCASHDPHVGALVRLAACPPGLLYPPWAASTDLDEAALRQALSWPHLHGGLTLLRVYSPARARTVQLSPFPCGEAQTVHIQALPPVTVPAGQLLGLLRLLQSLNGATPLGSWALETPLVCHSVASGTPCTCGASGLPSSPARSLGGNCQRSTLAAHTASGGSLPGARDSLCPTMQSPVGSVSPPATPVLVFTVPVRIPPASSVQAISSVVAYGVSACLQGVAFALPALASLGAGAPVGAVVVRALGIGALVGRKAAATIPRASARAVPQPNSEPLSGLTNALLPHTPPRLAAPASMHNELEDPARHASPGSPGSPGNLADAPSVATRSLILEHRSPLGAPGVPIAAQAVAALVNGHALGSWARRLSHAWLVHARAAAQPHSVGVLRPYLQGLPPAPMRVHHPAIARDVGASMAMVIARVYQRYGLHGISWDPARNMVYAQLPLSDLGQPSVAGQAVRFVATYAKLASVTAGTAHGLQRASMLRAALSAVIQWRFPQAVLPVAGLIQTTTAPVAVALTPSSGGEDLPLLCFRTSCAVNTSDLDARGKSAVWGACVAAALCLLGSSVRHALHPPSAWQAEQGSLQEPLSYVGRQAAYLLNHAGVPVVPVLRDLVPAPCHPAWPLAAAGSSWSSATSDVSVTSRHGLQLGAGMFSSSGSLLGGPPPSLVSPELGSDRVGQAQWPAQADSPSFTATMAAMALLSSSTHAPALGAMSGSGCTGATNPGGGGGGGTWLGSPHAVHTAAPA